MAISDIDPNLPKVGIPSLEQEVQRDNTTEIKVALLDHTSRIALLEGGDLGTGDMTKALYDPGLVEDDAFNRANHTGTQDVSTLNISGTPDTTTFLRGDDSWAVPPGAGGGGAVDSVVGETGAVTPTQIADSFDTLLNSAIWRGGAAALNGPTFDADATYDPVADAGLYTQFDVDSNAVELTLPDATGLAVTHFFTRINSALNLASITVAVSGQLRSDNGYAAHNEQVDTIYLGLSQTGQLSDVVHVWQDSGFWHVTGALRENAIDDLRFGRAEWIDSAQLAAEVGRFDAGEESGDFTFEQDDENQWKKWSGSTIDTATLPLLAGGTQITGRRSSAFNGTIALSGGVTSPDSLTIVAGARFWILIEPGTSIALITQGT